jgi:Phage capsid family
VSFMASSLSPAELARLSRPGGQAFERAAVAAMLARTRNTTPEAFLRAHYGGDDMAGRIIKAATSPATTSGSGWADALVGTGPIADFMASLAPLSAGARIVNAGLRVSLERWNTIALPSRSGAPDPANLPWVDEASPIPVRQLTFTNATLGPAAKLAVIVVLTRETAERTSAPEIIRACLREDAAASLDASLFSDTAASSARPAGLLAGTAPITATAGGGVEALHTDLRALVGAITANGAGSYALVMNPETALALQLLAPDFSGEVLTSLSVPVGTVIALEPGALAFGFGLDPSFDVSHDAAIHMDTAPAQIGVVTGGSPATAVSAPSRSLWQTDCVSLRTELPMAWSWRASGRIAWLEDATW